MCIRTGCRRLQSRKLLLHFRRPLGRLRADLRQRGLERRGVTALRGHSREIEQGRQIIGLCLQNILDQRLKLRVAVRPALALNFLRQLIRRAIVSAD